MFSRWLAACVSVRPLDMTPVSEAGEGGWKRRVGQLENSTFKLV